MLAFLQRIGKSLMFPIAMLPAAALLVRLGAEDLLDIQFISQAGNGILQNLALIFAIGVAMGFARDASGAAALSGAVAYLVLTGGVQSFGDDLDMGVFGGIIAGIVAGLLYNRYSDIKLPDWLAFFGGKRFVPIISAVVMVILAGIFGIIWPPIQSVINGLGEWMLGAGALGVGSYGFFNRLLIPIGLHHVINTLVWFDFGSFVPEGADEAVRGEINRFLQGDPSAGTFLAGFFPILMFGLPAACLAMYAAAKKGRRAAVGGMLFSIGFTAFLTGVTEPIEFSFMFLSPLLYFVHAVLTGISMMVALWLDIRHGFGFSAGFIDYVLNFGIAQNPLILFVQGLVFAAIYFVIFYFLIIKLDLKTPGREDEDVEHAEESGIADKGANTYDSKAYHYLKALGGPDNIKTLDYCATRLRLEMNNMEQVDEKALKRQGANGVMKLNKKNLHVIVGTTVDFLAEAMRKRMENNNMEAPGGSENAKEEQQPEPKETLQPLAQEDFAAPAKGKIIDLTEVPDEVFSQKMMGEGFAIDPADGLFVAPVDGEVINVFPTKHAIGIKAESGHEILVHVGLETVQLGGKGFDVFVSEGERVKKGDKLLQVDLDYVKENAASAISPIIFTNLGEENHVKLTHTGEIQKNQTNIIEFHKQ
ncbi:N-acetylglucosamine-specific PTS transporter subunit IIBC [Sediminibacillus albus]|uniref:PTS system, N-acetylglucosamine-specific IIC component n=1 Tax=Sediminibacillus albus TaxID=407036 RepID=A0A1G8YNC3_9BACI|nr:N-acetylglucosamine-specific PTS transporter subunit IIBC [Sediminibacillus albus]SDK03615.1 PTS system, N-acetylglucosamine-specific IIC component [Sediminibacillus albus]